MNTSTYIIFGSTNGYQASRNASFGRRTRIAGDYRVCNKAEAIEWLMGFACAESDNYSYNDEGTAIVDCNGNEIMNNTETCYSDDGYGWELIAVEDLTEADAQLAIDMSRVPAEWIYDVRPEMKPEEAAGE